MSQLLSNQTLNDMFALSIPILEKIVRPLAGVSVFADWAAHGRQARTGADYDV